MTQPSELDRLRTVLNLEAEKTIRLLEALPKNQYDFRPDPQGRSIGEMAWHLSEVEGYITYGLEKGAVTFRETPPNLQRPREVALLAPGFRRVHEDAMARLATLTDARLGEKISFAGDPMPIRDILWGALLLHLVHHRGQLSLMCRLAGGVPASVYGPNREEMEALREKMETAKA